MNEKAPKNFKARKTSLFQKPKQTLGEIKKSQERPFMGREKGNSSLLRKMSERVRGGSYPTSIKRGTSQS